MEKKPRSLAEIIKRMELINPSPDEGGHMDADDLLIEALRLVGRNSEYQKQAIERLIGAYTRIEKWYA